MPDNIKSVPKSESNNPNPWVQFFDLSNNQPINPYALSQSEYHMARRYKLLYIPHLNECIIVLGKEYRVVKVLHKLSRARGQVINIYLKEVVTPTDFIKK